ncbi:Signal transduction histidine kinase [Alteromonas sp. 38]|uniref:response regulator n=1 Tax=Alteromonas TaxID=226 RepID=UPI0012F2F1B4|nr:MULTISPECIES: response regulator [Alteromonas]CAD5270640.1 Signal transduction histidine kinase [Alteromonas sp. 154]VXB93920.1 Signal transduction histidine kinase [Alteromonas sp. 38]
MTEVIRVLLIEDDEDDYFLTSDYLLQYEEPRFQLTWVTNSADAIDALQRRNFDLCLLDYLLGAENAVDVLEVLKSNQFNLPVVILTGQSDSQVDELVMRAGAADYLQKTEIESPRFMRTIRYAMVRREIENERLERHKVEQQNKAKDKFLAHLGHELRTPLTSILGYTELLLDDKGNDPLAQELSIIYSNGKHLLGLLNDLLDMSRIMADKLELNIKEVHLGPFLTDIHSLMRLAAKDKDLVFDVIAETKIPEVIETDPTRLRQVLINLVSNAVKFTDTGAITVTVEVRPPAPGKINERLHFIVEDTGIGMPPDKLEKIFQPFEQIEDIMRANHGGAGLGLAISRELVAKLGGSINVDSVFGKGSRFSFSIDPGDISKQSRAHLALKPPSRAEASNLDLQVTGKVLIVDDIREIRRLTGHLVSQCHATVAYAENGVKALEAVLQAEEDNDPFHLVLMDIHMPVMNGIEALHAIRRHKSNVPVVAVTAASRKGLKQSLMDDGFDNVIGKPIERAALTEVLDQYLVRSQGPAVSKIETVKTVTQSTQAQPTSKKVLVIEDDEDAAELLQLFLVHQGHDVITANTGADAIERMNEVVFDHVLMDLTLPDYHGYDLAAELNQIQPKAKLVIVSGNEPDKDTMKHLGVSQSLLKPVSKEDLISVVS